MMVEETVKFDEFVGSLGQLVNDGLVVAFSGGVDSGFLLWAAKQAKEQYGGRYLAFTTRSASMPQHDIEDVNRFVAAHDVDHIWKESGEINQQEYRKNDQLRCYYCKYEQFDLAKEVADEYGYRWIAYGFNASDFGDTRPGHQAAKEHGILYPLASSNFTKAEIRSIMNEYDLELADKPSSPCLSSRIMTGVEISEKKLHDIDYLENILRNNGLRVFRLRLHEIQDEKMLRLEVDPAEMEKALECRQQLIEEASEKGYRWVTLDLQGYQTGGGNL